MKRLFTPVLAAALLAAPSAFGAAVVVYDAELGEEFEAKRQIVELAKEVYGDASVYDTGDELPEALDAALTPNGPLPDVDAVEPVPVELAGRLPHTETGSEWVQVGNHLVEVGEDGMIVMTVYEVLP